MCLIYNKSETFSCIIINVREASFSLEKQATRKKHIDYGCNEKNFIVRYFDNLLEYRIYDSEEKLICLPVTSHS